MGFSNLPIVTVQRYRTGSRYEPQFSISLINPPVRGLLCRLFVIHHTFNIAVISASVYKASTSLDSNLVMEWKQQMKQNPTV